MEPAVGMRLASSVVGPLVKKLFVAEGPGAGLVDKPVRLAGRVSFRGEKRTLTGADLHGLAAELVRRALRVTGERPVAADEEQAVVHALADTLHALGDLTMTDVQAVELGHEALAAALRDASGHPERHLSRDAALFLARLLDTACLHVLHFFTQRSTFVPRALVEQTRRQRELVAKLDTLIARTPPPGGTDTPFEQRYLTYVTTRHSHLTIYGIDLVDSPDRWPLDAAYLSLQALGPDEDGRTTGPDGPHIAAAAPRPAEQALAEHDRILLRGVAGSGKTTLVQWLAVTAARGEHGDEVPFVLQLRTLVRRPDGLPAPEAFLAAARVPFHASQPAGWADRVLTDGRGLLLVDGLDEIPERDRERTRRWLRELLEVYPANRWLVTSRPSAVREDWLTPDGFTELALTPMSRDDVAAFVARWHAAARAGASEPDADLLEAHERSLLDAVGTKPDLGRLATNPLMCGLICALHRDRRGYLPHGRQELYDAALSMLLARRDEERDMFPTAADPDGGIHLTELPQIQLLQRLAYWLIRNNLSEMDRERAQRIVADVLPSLPAAVSQGDAHRVLGYLLLRSGLLREPSTGTVEFVHRTFQDYLGAKAAVEDGDFGLLVRGAADEQWADVFRMAVAHARPRERAQLLGDLIASADRLEGPAATRVRILALASLEHATQLDPTVREAVERGAAALIPPRTVEQARTLASAGPLALELLPGPEHLADEEARGVVVTASLVGTDAALPVLARFRSHHDLDVRAQLAWTWKRFPTRRYGDEVVAHLKEDGLFFSVHDGEQLRFLRLLGGRRRLHLVGDIEPAELATNLVPDRVTALDITLNAQLADLTCLSALHGLVSLSLSRCPLVDDLTPLAALPLTRLNLTRLPGLERHGALDVLSGSGTLGHLTLGLKLEDDSLDQALPTGLPLRSLAFTGDALRRTGLRGLHGFRSLRQLDLVNLSTRLSDADGEEVARLPELTDLRIAWDAVSRHLPPLPGVTSLRLHGLRGTDDLSGVRLLFPNLREVSVVLAPNGAGLPEEVLAALPVPPTVVQTRTLL